MKFSDVALLKLSRQPAPDKDQEITGTAGRTTLSIRRRAGTGKISFQIRYRYHGKPRRLCLGKWPAMTVMAAERAAKKAQGEIAADRDPGEQRRQKKEQEKKAETVEELTDLYIQLLRSKGDRDSTVREASNIIKANITPVIGGMKIADVKKDDIFRVTDRIKERGALVMSNRTYSTLGKRGADASRVRTRGHRRIAPSAASVSFCGSLNGRRKAKAVI